MCWLLSLFVINQCSEHMTYLNNWTLLEKVPKPEIIILSNLQRLPPKSRIPLVPEALITKIFIKSFYLNQYDENLRMCDLA